MTPWTDLRRVFRGANPLYDLETLSWQVEKGAVKTRLRRRGRERNWRQGKVYLQSSLARCRSLPFLGSILRGWAHAMMRLLGLRSFEVSRVDRQDVFGSAVCGRSGEGYGLLHRRVVPAISGLGRRANVTSQSIVTSSPSVLKHPSSLWHICTVTKLPPAGDVVASGFQTPWEGS